jgi:amidophosphoribosyltransferase
VGILQVFKEKTMKQLKGSSCIGHNRYSTVGSSQLTNAQVRLLFPPI